MRMVKSGMIAVIDKIVPIGKIIGRRQVVRRRYRHVSPGVIQGEGIDLLQSADFFLEKPVQRGPLSGCQTLLIDDCGQRFQCSLGLDEGIVGVLGQRLGEIGGIGLRAGQRLMIGPP